MGHLKKSEPINTMNVEAESETMQPMPMRSVEYPSEESNKNKSNWRRYILLLSMCGFLLLMTTSTSNRRLTNSGNNTDSGATTVKTGLLTRMVSHVVRVPLTHMLCGN